MFNGVLMRARRVMLALGLVALAALVFSGSASAAGRYAGYVYAETNSTTGNSVLVYERASDGSLTPVKSIATGGTGTGTGLGSQDALALSENGRWLLAVNASSNDISVVSLASGKVRSRTASGGMLPISVTEHDGLVYVLNSGGNGNISGFWLRPNGSLAAIPGSTRALGGSGPAEVRFSTDGEALVVTEKGTNTIDTYAVEENGMASGPYSHPSSGAVPFGFDFGKNNTLVVSEAAASAASSYRVSDAGGLTLITGSVANGQAAACWVAVTQNGKYAFTADAHNGMISSYAVAGDGSLTLLAGAAGSPGGAPLDEVVSGGDSFLYVLNPAVGSINAFTIGADGSLAPLASASGIPSSAAGLVAR